jgi:hypothetical protein
MYAVVDCWKRRLDEFTTEMAWLPDRTFVEVLPAPA